MPPRVLSERRRAGLLLHPTSLPGPRANGDLGAEAYRFVDFLATSGQTVWQVLPLGPTHAHANSSPYQCMSAHAGNPLLISPEKLVAQGLLHSGEVTRGGSVEDKGRGSVHDLLIHQASVAFKRSANAEQSNRFNEFVERQSFWLEDFALYRALKREHGGDGWTGWDAPLRNRHRDAIEKARERLDGFIGEVKFEQYLFFEQWAALKAYANERGILIFGDMPIFVDHDSADVWANRDYFELDDLGKPTIVSGVPPDYFSKTGQRWGNPHYRWKSLALDGYQWWINRFRTQLEQCDLIRVDHFRGLEHYWAIPEDMNDATVGEWVRAPGDELLTVLRNHYGELPLVAEDLGIITPEVDALRDKFGLPGMRILQFAFDSDARNPYLPHNHINNCVVYTGTHDNNTTLGWYKELNGASRSYVSDYIGAGTKDMPWALIRSALASVAYLAIIPMQDVLSLGEDARMNTPGTTVKNWQWRFDWADVDGRLSQRLHYLASLYGRG